MTNANKRLALMSTPEIATEESGPVSAEVAAIRRATGWSQNKVARRASINPGVLSGLLSGRFKSQPAVGRIRRLADRLRRAGKLAPSNGDPA